jgi:two-component system, NarL family, response regulator NreC
MSIKILLADDHTILRQGLRVLLEAEPDFTVIGEASTGLEVLKKVETLSPDVVVLDLGMPELNGLEVTRKINHDNHGTRIVVLSMHAKEAYVLEALKNGASAYVLKGSDTNELIQAIRQVMHGARYLSPPLTERAVEAYLEMTRQMNLDPYDTLTNREREIFLLVVEGHSNAEVARRLTISPRTVEVHRNNLMHKLGLSNRFDLVRYAMQRGMIPMEEKI